MSVTHGRCALVLLLLCLLVPLRLAAGPLSDLVMAPGVLADLPQGAALRYSHQRQLPAATGPGATPADGTAPLQPPPLAQGEVILRHDSRDGQPLLVLAMAETGTPAREVASFPLQGPNPILLFFLENVMRSVTTQTGGSPFYLRNRIRDALVTAALPAPAHGPATVTLRPFAQDPHRDRLGIFADLTLTLTLDAARPGRLIGLKADTGTGRDGYSEAMTLLSEE